MHATIHVCVKGCVNEQREQKQPKVRLAGIVTRKPPVLAVLMYVTCHSPTGPWVASEGEHQAS